MIGASELLHFDLCLHPTDTLAHTPLISTVCPFPPPALGSGHQVGYLSVCVCVCIAVWLLTVWYCHKQGCVQNDITVCLVFPLLCHKHVL